MISGDNPLTANNSFGAKKLSVSSYDIVNVLLREA